ADVLAAFQVHDHAFARGQVADDRIARNRRATLGVAENQALGATNRQRALGVGGFRVFAGQQAASDDIGHAVAQADVFEQVFDDLQVVLLEHRLNALGRN